MNKINRFGEDVEGYDIPVLNEREIRVTAGILFLLMFISKMIVIFEDHYLMLKYAIVIFLTDFVIRVFVNPKFSPTLIIGRLIVKNQVPEYVGAQQKKFAWMIGVILSASMFVLIVVLNLDNPITTLLCYVCIIFLFFETAFGICIGCKIYSKVYKEKEQFTEQYDRFYTSFAKVYDGAVKILPFWKRWLKATLPHIQGPRVLEVSFGTGYLLMQYAGQFETYGIDYNERFVTMLQGKLGKAAQLEAIWRFPRKHIY